jgi:signal transduction histidine kinase
MSIRSRVSGIFFPHESSCWCVLLCDKDGRVIHDFGERGPAIAQSIPARSLIGLLESGGLADFLDTVRTCGVTRGWEMKIHYGGTARKILLHGFQTPQGYLIFAPLPPYPAKSKASRSTDSAAVTRPRKKAVKEDTVGLSELAHNLRNPVSSIISACEYLASYSPENLNREQREMLAGIESAAAALLQLSSRLSARVTGEGPASG